MLSQIRTAIANTLKTVSGIGLVHEFQRYSTNNSAFKDFFLQDDKVLGWYITRITRREQPYSSGYNKVVNTWEIRGFMSLIDGEQSEITAQNLIENIIQAFRGDETLGDLIDTTIVDNQAGLQMEEFIPVMFAGVLCHSIRFSLLTRHDEQRFKDLEDLTPFETGGVKYDLAPKDGQIEAEDIIKPEQPPS
ncbi:hypothetical protein [uncultured Kiloniella sp.]|uniref:hypothetical protein n=1 Tax=uncultured Kiloniella sp. TaxID=1133091 RepID=UPI002623F9BF|nr:hypothetical protein [uncultured Kiloniella sp.]